MNQNTVSVQKWAVSSRIFHWVSVVLLVVTWIMILLYSYGDNTAYIVLHKAFVGHVATRVVHDNFKFLNFV